MAEGLDEASLAALVDCLQQMRLNLTRGKAARRKKSA
jgi:hypothetical protein